MGWGREVARYRGGELRDKWRGFELKMGKNGWRWGLMAMAGIFRRLDGRGRLKKKVDGLKWPCEGKMESGRGKRLTNKDKPNGKKCEAEWRAA